MSRGLPNKWWDKGINPILGYKPIITPVCPRPRRNEKLYPKELDYKPQ